jgi:hypothetical protein
MTIQTGCYSGLADPDGLYGNEHHCVSRILESETFCQPALRARWKDYCPVDIRGLAVDDLSALPAPAARFALERNARRCKAKAPSSDYPRC